MDSRGQFDIEVLTFLQILMRKACPFSNRFSLREIMLKDCIRLFLHWGSKYQAPNFQVRSESRICVWYLKGD